NAGSSIRIAGPALIFTSRASAPDAKVRASAAAAACISLWLLIERGSVGGKGARVVPQGSKIAWRDRGVGHNARAIPAGTSFAPAVVASRHGRAWAKSLQQIAKPQLNCGRFCPPYGTWQRLPSLVTRAP